jgi:transposase
VSFAHRFSTVDGEGGGRVRSIGLDVHRDFCEVAIVERGEARSAGRIETTPAALELFGQSLGATDRVRA